MGYGGTILCIALVAVSVPSADAQGLPDIVDIVRNDAQRMAMHVHEVLGLEGHSTTASPLITMAPPTSTSWPETSSTAAPTTTAQPGTSTVPQSTSSAPPGTTSAPPATTASAPTTTTAPTSSNGPCPDPQTRIFSGTYQDAVITQWPFSFPGWLYGTGASSPPTYQQAIYNQASSTQVINITTLDGIILCQIAASGVSAATTATFNGITLEGSTITKTNYLPASTSYANTTFDLGWQPLQSITIVTTGDPTQYTTELWEISYQTLGVS